jgi:5-carboxymethyl-2-hydroxymuconic-semialdehyde dehydrogenase
VIFDDADLDRALDAAVFMIFSNNGERCTAGSRILVQKRSTPTSRRSSPSARRITVGDPLDEKTIVGPMISQAHLAKVRTTSSWAPRKAPRCCAAAWTARPTRRAARARATRQLRLAHRVRRRGQPHEDRAGRNLRPRGLPDPVRGRGRRHPLANDIQYGLSSYVWTENIGRAHRVAAAIEAGMCFVNSQNVRDLRQPFGGTKASGTGREGGTWSYEVFCEPKNIAVSWAATTSRLGSLRCTAVTCCRPWAPPVARPGQAQAPAWPGRPLR